MTTRTKWILSGLVALLIIGGIIFGLHLSSKKASPPAQSTASEKQQAVEKPSAPTTQSSTITQDSFSSLPDQDQANLRELVNNVRLYGSSKITPADCSILSIGSVHYAITSYWDKDYTRDSKVWQTPDKDNLWDPNLKKDVQNPGAWMIAYLSTDKSVKWSGTFLRWAAPPSTLTPPDVPQNDPIAQAANTAWKEVLTKKYAHFSFVKATAHDNVLQLHFSVVVNDKPQKVVVSVPIDGTYSSFTPGQVTVKSE
ncbi:hypothetical protein [Desulfitobacterium sp. AusDCA]|uniref:hypothetical protein n=1 Tax=Desulfitobacterium sp. AusDCA TaxID=3240383 RepID=UPI003DA76D9E